MRKSALILALVAVCAPACRKTAPTTTPPATEQTSEATATEVRAPKRTILFIGDGMGVGQLSAAAYMGGGPLRMMQMPHMAWTTTHEYEFLTTESASSASALSTGHKAHYEGISVAPGTTEEQEADPAQHTETLLELAAAADLGTGLIATSRIMHATPAAFEAHRYHRHQYEGIASDLVDSELHVMMGAGYEAMKFGENDYWAKLKEKGWHTATTPEELAARPEGTRVAALFHPQNMPFVLADEPRAMSLAEMVERTMAILDADHPDGWVLVVEGSFPDWCAHSLDMVCAAHESADLDRAVAKALDYAEDREDTLVVATADHETGGLTVLDPDRSEQFSKILGGDEAAAKLAELPNAEEPSPPPFQHMEVGEWGMTKLADRRATLVAGHFSMASRARWQRDDRFYAAHSPEMVAVFAAGPGAEVVTDARDNADVGKALRDLVARGARGESLSIASTKSARPKNVVLLIGDGMGASAVTAAHYFLGGATMVELPVHGMVATHAVDGVVNDSPGSGTALSSGIRTGKAFLGLQVDGESTKPVVTALEVAESKGRSTGIITTTSVTHATPAAFYAHRDSRDEQAGIVDDLVTLRQRVPGSDGIELLWGGGRADIDTAARTKLAEQGYDITETFPVTGDGPSIALLAETALAKARFRRDDGQPGTPTLAEMTAAALERMAGDEDGFLLVVEGGQIDWYQHELARDTAVLEEMRDFDEAVAIADRFAAERGDTLVIVTADHSHSMSLLDNHYAFESGRCSVAKQCGGEFEFIGIEVKTDRIPNAEGFANVALQGNYAPPMMHLQYPWPVQEAAFRVDVSAPHSANFVPVFARGPWSARLGGFVDQPEIGQLLLEWAR